MRSVFRELLQDEAFEEGVHWRRRYFPAGEEIIRQGDASRSLFMVEKGTVRVVARIVINDRHTASPNVCDLEEGEVFGELALFDDQPRSASVVAHTDCQVIEVDKEQLLLFMEEHPRAGYGIIRTISESLVARLRATNKKIFALYGWGLKDHLTDF